MVREQTVGTADQNTTSYVQQRRWFPAMAKGHYSEFRYLESPLRLRLMRVSRVGVSGLD